MAGISFLIFGTTYSSSYYIFQCRSDLFNFYLTMSALTCGLSFVITLMPTMHKPENKTLKGMIFLATGFINGFSLIHGVYVGYQRERFDDLELSSFHYMIILGCLQYAVGAMFYISKFPERSFPWRFDIWFNSHSIFHIFVAIAAFTNFIAIRLIYETRSDYFCEIEI
jgi:adiponectin receptor